MTFWDHLDVLRSVILKSLGLILVLTFICFCFKEQLFDVVLAPTRADFAAYRWLGMGEMPDASLINTGLASQFMMLVKTAFCGGVLLASPYILYLIFQFVAPALYEKERRYTLRFTSSGYFMFLLGVLICYFIIFPMTYRFLAGYQVSAEVANMITLDSYASTLVTLSLCMGVVFEMPVISWLLARLGLLTAKTMNHYRRHAVVVILVIAAIITPTSDALTLMVVSLPMWLLYEASILVVKASQGRRSSMAWR